MLFGNEQIKWIPEGRAYILLLIIGSLAFDTVISRITMFVNQKELLIANVRIFYTVFFILFAILNYVIFLHNDRWKKIIKSFSNLEKRKNQIGTVVVYLILLMIVLSWLYSMYLWTT